MSGLVHQRPHLCRKVRNLKLAPEVGFEPTTNRLTADRSTTELLWNVSAGSTESHPTEENWLRGLDLNQRPSGYEPDELPGCSTPRDKLWRDDARKQTQSRFEGW